MNRYIKLIIRMAKPLLIAAVLLLLTRMCTTRVSTGCSDTYPDGPIVEKVAVVEHEQWMEWSKAVADEVSPERRARWKRDWVHYDQLSEAAKEKDRVWARKVIEAITTPDKERK